MIDLYRFGILFIISSLSGLFLARIGVFEGYSVLIIGISFTILLSRYSIGAGPVHPAYAFGMLLAGLYAAYVFTFATAELDGGRDNGVYAIIANVVSERGSVDVTSPDFAERAGLVSTAGRYPGIFPGPDGFQAQFNHISPILRGAFIDIFGTDGLALSSAFFAFMALAAFCALSVTVAGWWGLLAVAMLMINAAFIYASRSTLSEVYALAFVVMSFLFARVTIANPRNLLAPTLTAFSVGMVMMARVDGYLLLPLVMLTAFGLLRNRSGMRSAIVMASLSAVFFAWSYLDLLHNSQHYFNTTYPKGLRETLTIGLVCLGGTVGMIGVALIFPKIFERLLPWIEAWGWRSSRILIGLLFVVAAAYYIRGAIPPVEELERVSAFMRRAPVEFTWYTSLPVILLAFCGALLLLRTNKIDDLALSVISIVLIVLFIIYARISPDHPWNSRRWVPFSIPFSILLFSYFIARVYAKWRVGAVVLLVAILPLYAVQQIRLGSDWWFVRLQGGYQSGFDDLAQYLREHGDKFYYATHSPRASILNFIYEIPTISIRSAENEPLEQLVDAPSVCGVIIDPYVADGYSLIGPHLTTRERCIPGSLYSYKEESAPAERGVAYELISGWSHLEDWGVWSLGNQAEVSALLPEGNTLRFHVRSFIPNDSFKQSVDIFIDGRLIGSIDFEKSSQNRVVDFKWPDGIAGNVNIKFNIKNPISPYEYGVSEDTRKIGLGLTSISVVE